MSDSTFLHIENAAHGGAFGNNTIPEPTEAQCIAGNYKVGRANLYGLPLAIEKPRGSYRTGIDAKTGKRWASRMAAHYGYISGTKGADDDAVDCFIGFYPQSETAYVINQNVGGRFDEHKVMLAFPDEDTARRAYLDSYERGWNGLASLVPASISQLKWWLKNGDLRRPLRADNLPHEGLETMTRKVQWNSDALPYDTTLDHVLYAIRCADAGEGLLMDAVTTQEIIDDAEGLLAFDALVSPYAKLERKMERLRGVMERTGDKVKPVAMQITEPFKQRGVANVAAIFELSDGQTVSIYFHNPDVTPGKIARTDEVISWKWLLNKKDITIVVAPERGVDLNVREVARRIMRLAEKNSPAFQRANTKRAERMGAIQSLKDEITGLEAELTAAQHDLEVAKVQVEDAVRQPVIGATDQAGGSASAAPTVRAQDPVTPENSPNVMDDPGRARAGDPPDTPPPPVSVSPRSAASGDLPLPDEPSADAGSQTAADDAPEPVAPVVLTGTELGEFADTEAGKKALRAAVRAHLEPLRGKWIDCPGMGRQVQLRQRGIEKMLSFSADPRKLKLIAAIESIIGAAKNPVRQANYKTDVKRIVQAYYRLEADTTLDGESLKVQVLIEEDAQGLLHYDIMLGRDVRTQAKTALDHSNAAVASRLPPETNPGMATGPTLFDSAVAVNPFDPVAASAEQGEYVLNLFIVAEKAGAQASQADKSVFVEPSRSFNEYLAEVEGDTFEAAKTFFKSELQGKVVKTVIGDVHMIGSGFKEMKRGMKSDALKAKLIPSVPVILSAGRYRGGSQLNKARNDGFVAFHFFEKDVEIEAAIVTAGVSVGERADGMYEYTAYGLGHSQQEAWAKRKASDAPGNEPGTEAFQADVSVNLDSILSDDDEEINIVILKVIDKATGERLTEFEDVPAAALQVPPQSDEPALIAAYFKSWAEEAAQINAAVAAINWEGITDTASAAAEMQKLRDANDSDRLIVKARDALEAVGIESWDERLASVTQTPGFKAQNAAMQAYRDARDRIEAIAKEKLIEVGKAELAALPEGAPLADVARAVFRKNGIDIGASWMPSVVQKIEGKDADGLRKILSASNKASAEIFERASGIKLAKTQRERGRQIDEWVGITPDKRADLDAAKDAAWLASERERNVKESWDDLNAMGVRNSSTGVVSRGQQYLLGLVGDGYDTVGSFKRGAATVYGLKKGDDLAFVNNRTFTRFLKAAIAFGGLRPALERVGAVAPQAAEAQDGAEQIAAIDAAYPFGSATDGFKLWLHESLNKVSDSPFFTAKAMDEAAKRHGASVEWDKAMAALDDTGHAVASLEASLAVVENKAPINRAEGDILQADLEAQTAKSIREAIATLTEEDDAPSEEDIGGTFEAETVTLDSANAPPVKALLASLRSFLGQQQAALDAVPAVGGTEHVGTIKLAGEVIGRIDIADDGKAMVYVGAAGDERVVFASGTRAMYSDDDAVLMVDALFSMREAAAPAPAVPYAGNDPDAPGSYKRDAGITDAPPVAGPDPQKDADRALFQSVIDGTVADILAPDLADDLEAAYTRNEGDAGMVALFEQAVAAYQAAMMAATSSLA